MPKPLVPVLGAANILHSLFILKRSGIREIIVNLFHLPDLIESFLQNGRSWELDIQFSKETQLLGTGGGVKKAGGFFGDLPFVLLNSDFITNVDLKPYLATHEKRNALATMVLWENEAARQIYSTVGTNDRNELVRLGKLTTDAKASKLGIFTGIHFLENSVLSMLPDGAHGINEVLYPRLIKETPSRVFGEFMNPAYWYDTGETRILWKTSIELLMGLLQGDPYLREFLMSIAGLEEKKPGVWAQKSLELPKGVEFIPPLILTGECEIQATAKLGPCVVLDGKSSIGPDSHLKHCLVWGNAVINKGEKIENQIVFSKWKSPVYG
jgi:NDP-sugar pyrophosphorylase family protein